MQDLGNVYISRLKRHIFISCLTVLVGAPCLGLIFYFILSPSAEGLGADRTINPNTMRFGIVTAFILLMSIIPLIVGGIVINRRAKQWDEVFLPLGFTGRMYMLNGRQYSRQDGNRRLMVYIYRGPTVEIRVSAPLAGDFRVFRKDSLPASLAGRLNTDGYISNEPGLESLVFYPADISWLPSFLKGLNVTYAIRELMVSGAEWAIFRRLEFHNGELQLHLSQSKNPVSFPLTQTEVTAWLRQLDVLADELQAAGLPKMDIRVVEANERSRNKLNLFLMGFLFMVVFVFPLCVIFMFLISYMAVGNG